MRIALACLHTSPLAQPGQGDAGGMNIYVRALAEQFAAAGHQVLVFTRADGTSATDTACAPAPWNQAGGPQLIPLAVGPAEVMSKDAIAELIDDFAQALTPFVAEADVVHSHYWISGAAAEQARKHSPTPIPHVHTSHTLGAVKNALLHTNSEHPQRLAAEAELCRNVTAIVVNTGDEAAILGTLYGVAAERVQVIAPGVDLAVFNEYGPRLPLPAPVSSTLPANTSGADQAPGPQTAAGSAAEDILHVVFAGRLQRLKGPDVLVAALKLLRQRWQQDHPQHGGGELPLQLVISGAHSGSEDYDVPAMVAQAGLRDLIQLMPPLPQVELASLLRSADLVVMPSHSESFGLVALEAAACGTPVLAHRVGGLAAAVDDGVSGQLVDSLAPEVWADALYALLLDRPRLARYAAAARHHAEQFSWQRAAAANLELYSTLVRN